MTYLLLKTIHILSMVLLFGTGFGSAFYKFMADRSRDIPSIQKTNRVVVLADWIFTTPTVIIQPVTGIMMLQMANIPLSTNWVWISLVLYAIAGLCWIPVVWIQIKMQKLSDTALVQNQELPDVYWTYVKIWIGLGIPAFIAMVAIVFLMVFKTLLF